MNTQHFAAERDEQVAKANKALGIVEGARVRRASVAQIQGRVDELLSALARLRKDNDKSALLSRFSFKNQAIKYRD